MQRDTIKDILGFTPWRVDFGLHLCCIGLLTSIIHGVSITYLSPSDYIESKQRRSEINRHPNKCMIRLGIFVSYAAHGRKTLQNGRGVGTFCVGTMP